jgi:hypothetical protein
MAKASGVRAAPKLSKPNRKGSVELDFHSLLRLIGHWTVAVLVTEIQRNGVMVDDGYGRLQQANDGDESDPRSRKFALKLLHDCYAEEQDPGPERSWLSERWDVETHPLETFGWPRRLLPKFGEIDIEKVVLGIEAPVPEMARSNEPPNSSDDWKALSSTASSPLTKSANSKRDYAAEVVKVWAAIKTLQCSRGNSMTERDLAQAVAEELQSRGFNGPQGRPLSAETIRRYYNPDRK